MNFVILSLLFSSALASVIGERQAQADNCTYTGALPDDLKCNVLGLPAPVLTPDFRLSVSLFAPIVVGSVDGRLRRWIAFNTSADAESAGNVWSASWGNGTVVGGGQDNQLILPNGATHLDTNYLLKTNDPTPAYLTMRTAGWRTGSPEVLARLANTSQASSVSPFEYSFLLYIFMETGDVRYNWTNTEMWIASGTRRGLAVIYDAYRLSS